MRKLLFVPLALVAALVGAAVRTVQDQCGPFTDLPPLYCPYVLEAYYAGITAGTSATTFSPDLPITRAQSAVFTTKALNQALSRDSRRAMLGQWWTTVPSTAIGGINLGGSLGFPAADGADIWVPNSFGYVSRVRASDGRLLETWTNASGATQALVAMGRVFVTGDNTDGHLYMIDPAQTPGDVTAIAQDLFGPEGIAFDGSRVWVTSPFVGTIWTFTPPSWTQTTLPGFQSPRNIVYDGHNIWVADFDANALLRLNASGNVAQSIAMNEPQGLVFDGQNL